MVVDEPDLWDAVILLDGSVSPGSNSLVVGQGQSVFLVTGEERLEIIRDLTGKLSALALGDLNGDLRDDLLLGTASAGALYIYTERNGAWERQGQPQYLWDSIVKLAIHDFNQDGWGDVATLTEQGVLHILLSQEGKLVPFWKSPADQVVTAFEVMDVDGNSFPDLIFTYHSGYVGAITWRGNQFSTLWENYPWGLIESLVVIPAQSEWLVVTSQKMLYGWRYQNSEIVASRHFHAADLGEHLYHIPGVGLLSFSRKSGAALFELKSASVTEKWRVPGVFGSHAFYFQGDYYFRDSKGDFHRIIEGDGGWRLFINGQDISDQVEVVERDGKLAYGLAELGRAMGYTVFGAANWHLIRGDRYFRVLPGRNLVEYDELSIPLAHPVWMIEGKPFLPTELLSLFGWQAEIDPARKHVVFSKNWGWWL